jgi:hypothetical protein
MNETDELIVEQIKTLPPNLRQAVNSVPWKALVEKIGAGEALNAKQVGSLLQETMFILYVFEAPTDYIKNIVREVGVTEEVAVSIAETVNNQIFEPILQKSEEFGTQPSVPEIRPINLPMVESGEVVHDVPHVEPAISTITIKQESRAPLPDYRYPDNKDPYREPLL